MTQSKKSRNWIDQHIDDEYVIRSQREGYRSRAAYKLMQIDDRDHLIKSNMTVVDLGAAPGGWSQVVAKKMNGTGRIVAVDLLVMESLKNVNFIQGDFTDDNVLQQVVDLTVKDCDLVISDMAPNITGIRVQDQASAMYLAELVLDFAVNYLKTSGAMVVKLFQGEGFNQYVKMVNLHFKQVYLRKPKASRPKSREIYLVAKDHINV